jgi:hypothetical protein
MPGGRGQAFGDGIGGACNAQPDSNRPQYVIGYGSLMQDESRKRTSPQASPAHPVEIRGYRRGWFARSEAAGQIDNLLSNQLRQYFSRIRIEPGG